MQARVRFSNQMISVKNDENEFMKNILKLRTKDSKK